MKSSCQDLKHSQKLLTVKVPASEFATFFDRALEKLGHKVKVDGFRPGRAPAKVVLEQVGAPTVDAEALDMCLSDTYLLALREHEINPVAYPEIEVKKMTSAREGLPEDEIVLEYTATIAALPEVHLKDLKRIKASLPVVAAPTEEEIEAVLTNLRRQKAITKEAEADRAAAKGDLAVIAYEGSLGGVAKNEMTNANHPLLIGEGNLIPGFEENLIGLKVGEKVEFDIPFPKDYGKADYAGKKGHFAVTLKELKELVLPEVDDVFAQSWGAKTADEFRHLITDNLANEKANEAEQKLQEDILKQLEQRTAVDLPVKLIEQEQAGMIDDLKKRVEAQGMTWDNYLSSLKRSEDDLKAEMKPQAERNIKLGLALGQIVKQEELKIENDQLAAATALEWLRSQATGQPMRPLTAPEHSHDHDHHDHKH
jgi:trigger factor